MELGELVAEAHLVQLVDRARGQAVAARLLPRERLSLDDRDVVPESREPVRSRGAGGPPAYDQYVSR
jgi:hypothetical protein